MKFTMLRNIAFILFFLSLTGAYAQVIDDSPTRVQTSLQPGLKQIGTLKPKSVPEIGTSRWTLGCETLDREYANYDSYKEYLVPLGIKRIRLQGGWARTERKQGIYDFAWLDYIIDDAKSRGLEIWLETSYGNSIYPDGGGPTLGDGFPKSEEALAAWDRWVEAMATRYKGKVRDWSMWNEPDKQGAEQVALFNIRTAEVIKSIIPDARIGALVFAKHKNAKQFEDALKIFAEKGKADLFHWVVYHSYAMNPDSVYSDVKKIQAYVEKYTPSLKLWQGENGTQSEFCVSGALRQYPWTELTQAKWDTRRMLGDIGHGADSLVFTACDMDYRTTSFHNGLVRYGLIKTTGAAQGFKVLKVKIAYYAVQNVVSLFNDSVELRENAPTKIACDTETASFLYYNKTSEKPLFVFWKSSEIPSDSNETVPVEITLEGVFFNEPVWIDLITGAVFDIPLENMAKIDGKTVFKNIPVYDAPTVLAEKSEIDYVLYPPTPAPPKNL